MTNINVTIYEDNAGGIQAVVRTEGEVTNVLAGLEREYTDENGLDGLDLLLAARDGFPFARDYDADDFGGLDAEDAAESVDFFADVIAEVTPEGGELYYRRMGCEGHYLFGYLDERG